MMATSNENRSLGMPSSTAGPQLDQPNAVENLSAAKNKKAIVVGLYGVPGSGKTYLLDQLKRELDPEHFEFHEGSEMIATLVPGGLPAFRKLEEEQKVYWRQRAIDTIGKTCANSGKAAVVAGHFMFWPEEDEAGERVHTQNDLATFTHILYLDVPAEVTAQRLLDDVKRNRPLMSASHLSKWQQAEKTELRYLCRDHGILFSLVSPQPTMLNQILTLLHDFRQHTEEYNLRQACSRMDEVVAASEGPLKTMLVMDADRTLTSEDTGVLFWQKIPDSAKEDTDPLKTLFSSPLGYSYAAFRQAVLLYEAVADDEKFDTLCQHVASSVAMHPDFVSLLQLVAEKEHVGAVVVTCGLRRVWEKVLENEGLSKTVQVIGGGRIADGFIVTAGVKAALVARLQNVYNTYVWAFGDSPLDLEMLCKADQAVVVVGDERTRSRTMDLDLFNTIRDGGLRACQVVLPSNASPRLDSKMLPIIQLTSPEFVNSVLHRSRQHSGMRILHATNKRAAKLLMTPTRDARNAGPVLREAHRRMGWYLATEFLADVIDTEEYPIPHVQGHMTSGYRLLNENETSIVALMRGGEAMALGVNDAFPLAMFVHASRADDIMHHHLQGKCTVVLVDSVVNSGKTVIEFVQQIRKLHATIRIVIIAGVVQAQSISRDSPAHQAFNLHAVSLVALRLSDNKFTGKGTTDTGNRLFNTTHLP